MFGPKAILNHLRMGGVSDFNALRLAIGRESAAFQNLSNSSGNNSKRLKLIVRSQAAAGLSLRKLEHIFTGREAPLWTERPTSVEAELHERVSKERRKASTQPTARKRPPEGRSEAERVGAICMRFVRDPNVIAWVLEEAAGNCEVCCQRAPFEREDGELYLEVHHVRPLANGGPDTIDNAIACCPNCHRNLHHGKNRNSIRQRLFNRLPRLVDWPERNYNSDIS